MYRSVLESVDVPSLVKAGSALVCGIIAKRVVSWFDDDNGVDRGLRVTADDCCKLEREISRAAATSYNEHVAMLLADMIEAQSQNDGVSNEVRAEQFVKRLMMLIQEEDAVLSTSDITMDDESLVWRVYDPQDVTPLSARTVVYLNASFGSICRECDWKELGKAIDPYRGLLDPHNVDEATRKLACQTLGYIPPDTAWWRKFTFGNGAASGLQGVCALVVATKIMLETVALGSLRGVVVIASVARQKHERLHKFMDTVLPPDCIVLSEATGYTSSGPCGIGIRQWGRAVIDATMLRTMNPKFPIALGAKIVAQATASALNASRCDRSARAIRSAEDGVLSEQNFYVRFVKTLASGDNAGTALLELQELPACKQAQKFGMVLRSQTSEDCPPWNTPRDHSAVFAISDTYRHTVSPHVNGGDVMELRKDPVFVSRAKGDLSCGYPAPQSEIGAHAKQDWITADGLVMPPILAIGNGLVENVNLAGEYVNNIVGWAPIAVLARFPSRLREEM